MITYNMYIIQIYNKFKLKIKINVFYLNTMVSRLPITEYKFSEVKYCIKKTIKCFKNIIIRVKYLNLTSYLVIDMFSKKKTK